MKPVEAQSLEPARLQAGGGSSPPDCSASDPEDAWKAVEDAAEAFAAVEAAIRAGIVVEEDLESASRLRLAEASKVWLEGYGWMPRQPYHDLLYAVESAFPGESRHETALRYIRERENRLSVAAEPNPEVRDRPENEL